MSKHTKGPWRVNPSANCDVQTVDGQFEIATTHPEILCGGECDRTAALANAALIAAAPDMAKELADALDLLVRLHDGCPALTSEALTLLGTHIERMSAVIAKATRP